MNLKGRSNFTTRYLNPAIEKRYVAPLYPDALGYKNLSEEK